MVVDKLRQQNSSGDISRSPAVVFLVIRCKTGNEMRLCPCSHEIRVVHCVCGCKYIKNMNFSISSSPSDVICVYGAQSQILTNVSLSLTLCVCIFKAVCVCCWLFSVYLCTSVLLVCMCLNIWQRACVCGGVCGSGGHALHMVWPSFFFIRGIW